MLQQDRIARWRIAWAQHRRVLDLQHGCATWSLPPDAIVVEPDPERAVQLIGRNQFRPMMVFGPGMRDGPPGPRFVTAAARQDLNWIAFQQAVIRNARGVREQGAVVFAHRLRSRARGANRIVVIEYFGQYSSVFWTTVIEPGGWTGRSPQCLRCGDDPNDLAKRTLWVGEPGLRLFAGQPDPADRSKFTIAYEIGPTRGTLHGQLRDDETIVFTPGTGMIVSQGRQNGWYPTSQSATSTVSGAGR
ncbi:MAG: hypothetical protein QOE14_1683 [Humisphaera sp.]|nr:hypothetical protein [Humisphaera sp.]